MQSMLPVFLDQVQRVLDPLEKLRCAACYVVMKMCGSIDAKDDARVEEVLCLEGPINTGILGGSCGLRLP